MPTPQRIRAAIYTATVAGWLLIIASTTPIGDHIGPELRTLAVLVAAVGSVKYVMRRMYAPAHELYAAGKLAGRCEALAELRDGGIVRLDERRLRVVDDRQA